MPQKHRQLDSPIAQQTRIKRQEISTPNPVHQLPMIHPLAQLDLESSDTWAACAKCALTIGHIELAFTSCQRALEKNPANPLALCVIAQTYRQDEFKNKNQQGIDNALAILNDSVRKFPILGNEPTILKELAQCQYSKGLYDQSHVTLERALQINDSDASIWLLEGKSLVRIGTAATKGMAINALHCALSRVLKPLSYEDANISRSCHSELAAIAFSDGNVENASIEMNHTLGLPLPLEHEKFDLSCTWSALALTREREGDLQGALQTCDTAEKSLGYYPRLLITEAYLLLVQPTLQSAAKAIMLLQNVLHKTEDANFESKEGDFLPYYLLGCAYAFIDDPANAYEALHIALSRAPTLAFPWLSVGSLYLKLNQLRDSLAAYSKAAKLKEEIVGYATCVVTWKGLACVYERCDKQFSDAANACSRAATYARLAGDMRSTSQLEQRSHALLAASRSEAPVPKLQAPPDPPLQLLRDIVSLSAEERIDLINRQSIQQQQLEQQQIQPAPQPQPMQPQASVHFQHPGVPQAGPPPQPQQFSPRQQVGYQQQFSPRQPIAYQQQYQLAPINREGQSTPLARPNVTLPSPTSTLHANDPQQYHYPQGKSIPPINAHHQPATVVAAAPPQIRPGGHYSQFPHPADQRPRDYI